MSVSKVCLRAKETSYFRSHLPLFYSGIQEKWVQGQRQHPADARSGPDLQLDDHDRQKRVPQRLEATNAGGGRLRHSVHQPQDRRLRKHHFAELSGIVSAEHQVRLVASGNTHKNFNVWTLLHLFIRKLYKNRNSKWSKGYTGHEMITKSIRNGTSPSETKKIASSVQNVHLPTTLRMFVSYLSLAKLSNFCWMLSFSRKYLRYLTYWHKIPIFSDLWSFWLNKVLFWCKITFP